MKLTNIMKIYEYGIGIVDILECMAYEVTSSPYSRGRMRESTYIAGDSIDNTLMKWA